MTKTDRCTHCCRPSIIYEGESFNKYSGIQCTVKWSINFVHTIYWFEVVIWFLRWIYPNQIHWLFGAQLLDCIEQGLSQAAHSKHCTFNMLSSPYRLISEPITYVMVFMRHIFHTGALMCICYDYICQIIQQFCLLISTFYSKINVVRMLTFLTCTHTIALLVLFDSIYKFVKCLST